MKRQEQGRYAANCNGTNNWDKRYHRLIQNTWLAYKWITNEWNELADHILVLHNWILYFCQDNEYCRSDVRMYYIWVKALRLFKISCSPVLTAVLCSAQAFVVTCIHTKSCFSNYNVCVWTKYLGSENCWCKDGLLMTLMTVRVT